MDCFIVFILFTSFTHVSAPPSNLCNTLCNTEHENNNSDVNDSNIKLNTENAKSIDQS
jgi:hypothetical protein